MAQRSVSAILISMALASLGCAADVKTTDDSVKVEVEGPKVEIGEKSPDLDPATDDDVDVDTPRPGDK